MNSKETFIKELLVLIYGDVGIGLPESASIVDAEVPKIFDFSVPDSKHKKNKPYMEAKNGIIQTS